MQEQMLAIPVPQSLYLRLRKFAEFTHLPLENLIVQTLEATIPAQEDCFAHFQPTTQDAAQEPIFVMFQRISPSDQAHMEALMDKNNDGLLTEEEQIELERLVAEYQQILVMNSETLLRINQPSPLEAVY